MIYSVLKLSSGFLLKEQLLALRTQGGIAQGASTQRIKILDHDLSLKRSGSINLMRWVEAPWAFPHYVLKASNFFF
jgi:hypothetical protein